MKKDWELYLSRPFDLFGTTLWNSWYTSPQFEKLFGTRFLEGLFVECPKGVSNNCRLTKDIRACQETARAIVLHDRDRAHAMLDEGFRLNEEAQRLIDNESNFTFSEALEFMYRLVVSATLLPYYGGEALAVATNADTKLKEKCVKLREVSLYPAFCAKVVRPLAERRAIEHGVASGDVEFVTLKELLAGDFSCARQRRKEAEKGKFYVFEIREGKESVSYTPYPQKIIEVVEQTAFGNTHDIRGTSAFPGKARGTARIVLEQEPNAVIFNEGDILIAISTSPTLLPLMKKASAFVTDEGGITSHAAILSRELRKPCIIGTKMATRTFKNGDLVEIDANVGIVQLLKAEALISPSEYEYLWSNHDVNFIFTSCYLSPVFRAADIVLIYDWKAGELKYFLSKASHKKVSGETAKFFQNERLFSDWKKQIKAAIKNGDILAGETSQEKTQVKDMDSDTLRSRFQARVSLFQHLCDLYFRTEFFAIDTIEQMVEAKPNEYGEVKVRLEEMAGLKFKARASLNQLYNYRMTFQPYTEEVARRYEREDIEWLSHQEIISLLGGTEIPRSSRDEEYWLLAKKLDWKPVYGQGAKDTLNAFDSHFFTPTNQEIRGTIASRGVYRGTARVLRTVFSDAVANEIKKMSKGDVLVANTTGPEIMAACALAGAIVTDEGGLTSHAAIVSRELKIPCIVGTKIGSKVITDGDLVEVDANNGIVRLLES